MSDVRRFSIISRAVSVVAQKKGGDSYQLISRDLGTAICMSLRD